MKVGMEVSYLHLEDYFKRHSYPLQDTAPGLLFAQKAGWIQVDSFHRIKLRQTGFEALKKLQREPMKRAWDGSYPQDATAWSSAK
jgi:hypothetical protein